MTGFFAAGQNDLFGGRFPTEHTHSGLSHHGQSRLGLLDWIIHECERWRGPVGFFIEKQKGHVGGKGPMRRRPQDALGGDGVGGPPPPSLDRPWCIARIGVYRSSEATGRHS